MKYENKHKKEAQKKQLMLIVLQFLSPWIHARNNENLCGWCSAV